MRLDEIDRVMVLESVESIGVRTVPLRKYLIDYDNRGNPYPGGIAIARHEDFSILANSKKLRQFGQFAVDLFGYPYDKDEILKIASRIVASKAVIYRQLQKDTQAGPRIYMLGIRMGMLSATGYPYTTRCAWIHFPG